MEPPLIATLFRPDPGSGRPLVTQLYQALRAATQDGRLSAGETLPSSRAAAAALGLARNTVNAAYDLLRAEGVVEIRAGAAPRVRGGGDTSGPVATQAAVPPETAISERGRAIAFDPQAGLRGRPTGALAPGEADPALFPADDWARCLRRAARRRHGTASCYESYHGLPALRMALADQLHRHRGLVVEPERILVTPGTQASLVLLAQGLADPGDRALIEEPGYPGARKAFGGAGLVLDPLPVDAEGADAGRVEPGPPPRLVYVTPSTQYPSGVRMTLPRRLALLDHAAATGALVVEDDYDCEFVWRGREIAALQGLRGGANVLYLGSAAKSLLPGLRVGWLVVPPDLVAPLRAIHRAFGLGANVHAQAALAAFLETGSYRAHIRRLSQTYAERGCRLSHRLRSALGDAAEVSEPDGGLQLLVRFRKPVDERAMTARLAGAGYSAAGLSGYCLRPSGSGLVVGFGDATERNAGAFAALLGRLSAI